MTTGARRRRPLLPRNADTDRIRFRQSWGLGLYLTARHFSLISVLAGVAVAGQLVLRSSLAPSSLADQYLVALSPLAVVVVVGGSLWPFLTEWEDVYRGRLRRLRVAHMVIATAICLAGAVPIGTDDAVWVARNSALLLGLTLLCAVAFEPQLSWVVPVTGVGFCYLFGRGDSSDAPPAQWAILLHRAGWPLTVLSLVVLVSGLLAYIVRGPRRLLSPESI